MHAPHPIHRRYFAEDLVRLRRAGEKRRYLASQRRGRIDPNPHQIEAVMFALKKIPEGGCILADEVGLGKTIEAGLILAQLLAEGASRILIILPRPLIGQWQSELYTLFGIEAREIQREGVDLAEPGVYLAGREYAGGLAGSARLTECPPFDLVVIDEAHEIFAGIHRRFDRDGIYSESSKHAQTAHRVRQFIGASPVLLLTATPMQNSLAELWGLIQYIEPSGTLLGPLPVFKLLFCEDSDTRRLVPEQAEELRRRLDSVVKRTLRRQAQEFLEHPFVGRHAQLFEYPMRPEERALYEDVTQYLLAPNLIAFRGSSRQLLLLGFHRRMASSTKALAQSLEKVAERLERIGDGLAANAADDIAELAVDLEDEEFEVETSEPEASAPTPEAVREELTRVRELAKRARALPSDSKAESLVEAVKLANDRPEGSRKVLIFTESLTTQAYLRDLLVEQAHLQERDITLFRGTNDSARAREALAVWQREIGDELSPHTRPDPEIAVRLALIHEFKTRSSVFISTEAGAKGLNLQFCDTVINYDLPWNPQRIEQRIGRCHRYGQTRDVTIINFLAKDNEAQRLTIEILGQKLDLFGEVLDMSDAVLHTSRSGRSEELATALGPDFERQLRRIWDRARSIEEVESELRDLRDSIEERRGELERVREHTVGLIESRLDDTVRQVFRQISEELPATLAELDAELDRVLTSYLAAIGAESTRREEDDQTIITVAPSPALPDGLAEGLRIALGSSADLETLESLHSAHPLIEAAVDEARRTGAGSFEVRFRLGEHAPESLKRRRGGRGRLALTRVSHRGFEREDRLMVTALFENEGVLRPASDAHALLRLDCEDVDVFDTPLTVTAADLDEVVDEEFFFDQSDVAKSEQESFEQAIDQLDQHMEDRILVLRRARSGVAERLRKAEESRDSALGPDARKRPERAVRKYTAEAEQLDAELERLVGREDAIYTRWRDRAHSRRYRPPVSERLLDVEFVLE